MATVGDLEERQLRADILELVRRYAAIRHGPAEFIPGTSPVPFGGRVFDDQELVTLVGAALDFWLTEGPYSSRFTQRFAQTLGMKYVVLTNSGSSANLLAFSALLSPSLGDRRLRPGDEVITVAAAFPTTVNPILQTGCVPVFVDIEPGTYNIDVSYLDAALSPRTRAVFLAHTLGNPFDLGAVMAFARRHDLFVIEDCCDALGSTYEGRLVGTFGDCSTYSFYPPHHITMGEGGAVATRNSRLYRAVGSLRNWGRDCWCPPGRDNTCGKRFGWCMGALPAGYDHKYIITHIGYNLKPTDLQAAIGLAQLGKLPAFEAARRRHFRILYQALQHYEEFFHLPQTTPGADPCWFGLPLAVRSAAPFGRADLTGFLEARKILTRPLFAGNILRQPAYESIACRAIGELPWTDFAMTNALWLGVYPGLTGRMLEYVIDSLQAFIARYRGRSGRVAATRALEASRADR